MWCLGLMSCTARGLFGQDVKDVYVISYGFMFAGGRKGLAGHW